MNKFKGILVLGTGVNVFCGSSCGIAVKDVIIEGAMDVTYG